MPLGNFFNRLVFSLVHGERNILFNASINDNSKIMYVRNPSDRVKAVAPWLTLDTDPYPAVVDGRVTWIVDGYTTLANYPYAKQMSLGDATATALQGVPRLPDEEISYIRNSVKATVDAYDGTVTHLRLRRDGPGAADVGGGLPGRRQAGLGDLGQPPLALPLPGGPVQGPARAAHRVPRRHPGRVLLDGVVLGRPVRPDRAGRGRHRGLGATAVLPARRAAGPERRDLPADQRAGQPGAAVPLGVRDRELRSRTYGKITVLELPAETQTLGPQQVQAQFLGSPEVSSQLNLLRQNQTTIEYGNLLTLPVAGGLLYVEPVYIERAGQSASYPVLARVLVSYNGRVGYDASLQGALEDVFGAGCGQRRRPAGAAAQQPAPGPARRCRPRTRRTRTRRRPRRRSSRRSASSRPRSRAATSPPRARPWPHWTPAVQRYQQVAGAPPAPAPAAGRGRLTGRHDRRTGDMGLAGGPRVPRLVDHGPARATAPRLQGPRGGRVE